MSGSDHSAKRDSLGQRLLFWFAIIAATVVFGLLALRLYDTYVRAEPEGPEPIRIFRTPTNKDYSSLPASDLA